MKILVLAGITLAAALASVAHAATGLAVTCSNTAMEGHPLADCNGSSQIVYKTPAADTLVRDCGTDNCWTAGDSWVKFQNLVSGHAYEVCDTNIAEGAVWVPTASDPCTAWHNVVKTSVVTTSSIELEWTLPDFTATGATPQTSLTGYKIYSSVGDGAVGLIKTVPAATLSTVLTGYQNGTYSFYITAVYGTAESLQTGPLPVTVAATAPVTVPMPARGFSIKKITVEVE